MELPVLDAVESGEKAGSGERLEPPAPALIPGWRCLPRALLRVGGEEGVLDLVALHPDHGVALIALLEEDEEASPEEASIAFRAMLEEAGFGQRFPGELPVLAWSELREEADNLAASVERRFAALPAASVGENWVDWVAERLAPAPAAAAEAEPPRLEAPLRDEPPPVAEAAIAAPEDGPPAPLSAPRRSWLDWGASLGFAVGIALAMALGLAMLTHSGRLF